MFSPASESHATGQTVEPTPDSPEEIGVVPAIGSSNCPYAFQSMVGLGGGSGPVIGHTAIARGGDEARQSTRERVAGEGVLP